jgi:hypothetical protein
MYKGETYVFPITLLKMHLVVEKGLLSSFSLVVLGFSMW